MILIWLFRTFFSLWLLLTLGVWRSTRRLPKLKASTLESYPPLTVLIPAANEQESIKTTIQRLLACNYPDLKIIAVNDRSTDETGSILNRLAEENNRLEVIHIEKLPDGWMGKVHALNTAWQRVTSPWFLVCDADVSFAPDSLKQAVQHAMAHDLDHLSLVPQLGAKSKPAQWVLDNFSMMGVAGIPFDHRGRVGGPGFGIGAFQLIKSDFFKRCPGFPAIQLEVIDDIALGQMIYRSGGHSGIANGASQVSLTWYANWRTIILGLEKNLFAAATGYRIWPILPIVLAACLFLISPVAVWALGSPIDQGCVFGGMGLHFLGLAIAARHMKVKPRHALASPFALATFLLAFCHSSWVVLCMGGVRWRGTFYPLSQLRKQRDAKRSA
ncbi:MAG: glycosyltransferase [Acidobacteria bacterium]|nr:glycosyltransferase [Acidobacteriota bacterium]